MNKIICPGCNLEFELSEVLKHDIEEALKKTYQTQLDAARKAELDLRKQKNDLEEKQQTWDLEKQRQLDQERALIRDKTLTEASEAFRLREKEYEKKLEDTKKALEDAQRKASQTSQQLQGEVQELDLENTLKMTFPGDLIEPVDKGTLGADVSQTVKSPLGNDCGIILWESKRTKAWSGSWINKLKDDTRASKANIAAIVSEVVPEEAKNGIGFIDNVWVATPKMAQALALLLRKSLLDTARERAVLANQKDNSALLYKYVTSHEFAQTVEMMLEVYKSMQDQISKERIAMEKLWKTREIQVQKLMMGVSNVYGNVQGIVGPAVPQIAAFELGEK
jgi:hypothetical protein